LGHGVGKAGQQDARAIWTSSVVDSKGQITLFALPCEFLTHWELASGFEEVRVALLLTSFVEFVED